MKKFYHLSLFLVLGMMTASLTSCGGDDDLLDDNEVIEGGNEPYDNAQSGYKYFEPCLEWGCDRETVKTFMAGCEGWRFEMEDDNSVYFSTPDPLTYVTYRMYGGKLHIVSVQYYSTKEWEELKDTLEKNYHCTLALREGSFDGYMSYMAENVNVNGKRCAIIFTIVDGMMSVTIGD